MMNKEMKKVMMKGNTDELVHKDFVSRQDFINRTGIYVTPLYFEIIYERFVDSGISTDEFIDNYEEKYSSCIEETPLSGTFKYEVEDTDISGMDNIEEDQTRMKKMLSKTWLKMVSMRNWMPSKN